MYKVTKKWLLVLLILFLATHFADAQCAMCRATVDSNLSEGRGVIGTGINFGILYLLSVPYLLVAGLFIVYRIQAKKELSKRLALEGRIKQIFK